MVTCGGGWGVCDGNPPLVLVCVSLYTKFNTTNFIWLHLALTNSRKFEDFMSILTGKAAVPVAKYMSSCLCVLFI